MCSPMSAKATIASRFAAISLGHQAEQCRGKVDIGEPGILRVEAGAQLQQRADAPTHVDAATRRRDHAGDDLEKGRLAGTVLADDAE